MQQESLPVLCERAATKDPGFDLYWMAVALNRAESFPDEIERWPVQMLVACDARLIKTSFRDLALQLMYQLDRRWRQPRADPKGL